MAVLVERIEGPAASGTGPVYLLLFPIAVVCFLAAVVTDAAYARSAYLMWLHFSEWLIAAGLLFGLLAALVLLIEFIVNAGIRRPVGWIHGALLCLALLVELFNAFVHTIDGWTAVVPTGITLSIVGALLALGAVASVFRMPVAWVVRREVRP